MGRAPIPRNDRLGVTASELWLTSFVGVNVILLPEMAVRNIFKRVFHQKQVSQPIIVVSGLPRSGTSLMMQMLAAGGMEVLSDHERSADADNPLGYYELERVKQLREGDSEWLEEAQGKCVKVISALLDKLPPDFDYKVIFLQRELAEVLASQKQMLIRRGEPTDKVSDEEMHRLYKGHLDRIRQWLYEQKNFQVMFVRYSDLLDDPVSTSQKLADFLDTNLDPMKMSRIPDPKYYRQKGSSPSGAF